MSNAAWHEQPKVFECGGDRLIGIATLPQQSIETGVIIIVGGPQYRAGSHRQFTLLARHLAEESIASFRFDYRGMGDSEGGMRNFEAIDADIKAAIDAFMVQAPKIKKIVLWGLCDAASAALYYGHTDPRVKAMILLNPWVHTDAGAARARLKHYYLARLLSKAFWAKLLTGKVKLGESIGDINKSAQTVRADNSICTSPARDPRHGSEGYIVNMLYGVKCFPGNLKFILSGEDLTAQEFENLLARDKQWHTFCEMPRVQIKKLLGANHTFSNLTWRNQVSVWSVNWIKSGGGYFEA